MSSQARPIPQVAAVLLAAGEGRRLGLGPKALLEDSDGITLVRRITNVLIEGGCLPPVVVIGAGADMVVQMVDLSDCAVIKNPSWREGMGSSFRRGVCVAPAGIPIIVALVDQPGISVQLVQRLIGAHFQGCIAGGGGIETPVQLCTGRVTAAAYVDSTGQLKRGHPVIFQPEAAHDATLQAEGDGGARRFLADNPQQVNLVDCSDLSDGGDIDILSDLFRLGRQ